MYFRIVLFGFLGNFNQKVKSRIQQNCLFASLFNSLLFIPRSVSLDNRRLCS
jgi:hypothetical protein